MKILFVYPRFKYPSGQPPLGIASIVSYLKQNVDGLHIDVFDATFKRQPDWEQEFSALVLQKYDAVLFSVMTTMANDAHKLAGIVKALSPETKVVFGGPHATILPDMCLEDGNVDLVIKGEGEYSILDYIKNGLNPENLNGSVYKKDGMLIYGPDNTVIDIDTIGQPDRSIFDMEKYILTWNSMDSVSQNARGTSVIVSRGCPFMCSFCQPTLQQIFGRKVRKRKPAHVIEELKTLKKNYALNTFMFEDDTFMMDKAWVEEICNLLIKSNMDYLWCCNMRADLCQENLLKTMYSAGLRKINIGIETATQRLLDEVYKKGITVNQITNAVNTAKRLGIKVQGYFMIGHPTETLREILNTILLARNLDIDNASFSVITPFPGTSLFEREKQLITKHITEFDYYCKCVYSPELMKVKPATIQRLKSLGYVLFYTRPFRVIAKIRALFVKGGFEKLKNELQRV